MSSDRILFSPISIGKVSIKNRFAMAPMGPLGLGDAQGGFNQRGIDYYTARARGGTGLIITGVTFVDNTIEEHGMPNCPNSTYNPVQFVRTAREMTERVHAYNARIFLQMSGGFGRVTIPTNLGEFPPVAPSPIQHRWLDKTCRALTVDEIHELVRDFGEGAYNAKRAGFDGVQIHAVHEGYLIDQFAISLFNQRTDREQHVVAAALPCAGLGKATLLRLLPRQQQYDPGHQPSGIRPRHDAPRHRRARPAALSRGEMADRFAAREPKGHESRLSGTAGAFRAAAGDLEASGSARYPRASVVHPHHVGRAAGLAAHLGVPSARGVKGADGSAELS